MFDTINKRVEWSQTCRFSVAARIRIIWIISSLEYGSVLIISNLSRKSRGIPWGATMSLVPRTVQFPRLVANTTIGAIRDSSARCYNKYEMINGLYREIDIILPKFYEFLFVKKFLTKYVKHWISSIWTSSMNNTPGTSSAIPSSIYLLTTYVEFETNVMMSNGSNLRCFVK